MDRISKWYVAVAAALGGAWHVYVFTDMCLHPRIEHMYVLPILEGPLLYLWPGSAQNTGIVGYAYFYIFGTLLWAVPGAIFGFVLCGFRLAVLFMVRRLQTFLKR